jgi:hypothetical protein
VKLYIRAFDGSTHTYPEGFTVHWEIDGWMIVRDETSVTHGWFFRPAYAIWRNEVQHPAEAQARVDKEYAGTYGGTKG